MEEGGSRPAFSDPPAVAEFSVVRMAPLLSI
jgi:hypothetical protein